MTNNLPAALASALFAFSPEGADAINAAKRAAYIEALKRHDWLYEFSEDPLVLNRGREQSAQLRLAQRELDAGLHEPRGAIVRVGLERVHELDPRGADIAALEGGEAAFVGRASGPAAGSEKKRRSE